MAFRVIHTADVHLDATFGGRLAGERGTRKREAIRNTFRRIVTDCIDWPADMLVIAGDLFEEERIAADTVGFLKAEFARLRDTPVIIAPGNHDPYTVRGRYAVTEWPANVRIFTKGGEDTFRFESLGVTVHGLAHTSTHMEGRLCAAVKASPGEGGLHLLAAHASDETAVPPDKEAGDVWLPFGREELARLGYDYTALGHYHGPYEIEAGECIVAAYPGSPEGLRASEKGPRRYLRVTLEPGRCEIERRPVGEIEFISFEVRCDGFESRQQFFDAVERLVQQHPGMVIARVAATGRVEPGFDLSSGLPEEVAGRFFSVTVDDQTQAAYDWEAISAERTLRAEVVRRIEAEMEGADEARRAMLERARLYAMDALSGRQVEVPAEVLRAD